MASPSVRIEDDVNDLVAHLLYAMNTEALSSSLIPLVSSGAGRYPGESSLFCGSSDMTEERYQLQ